MAAVAEAQVRLTLVDRLSARLGAITGRLARLTSSLSRLGTSINLRSGALGIDRVASAVGGLTSRLHTAVSQVALLGAGLGGLAGIGVGFGASQLIGTNAEFERFGAVLETVLGSAEKAESSLAWISDFAAKTPYDLAGVTDAFVMLTTRGFKPMEGSLMSAGDAAAAMGKPLEQAVEALADAVTGENERLKEFGITASIEGNKIRYNWTENGKAMTAFAKKNSRAQIEATVTGIWNRQYTGAMDKLSTTWEGMVSNLGDTWARFMLAIGDAGAFDALKGVLGDILAWVNRMTASGKLTEWAAGISDSVESVAKAFKDFLFGTTEFGDRLTEINHTPGFLENLPGHIETAKGVLLGLIENFQTLMTVLGPLADLVGGPVNAALLALGAITFGPLLAAIAALVPAVWSLSVALLTTPFGWVIAGVGLLAGAVYVLYQKWDEFVAYWSDLWDRITSAFDESFTGGILAALREFNPVTHIMRGMNAVIEYFAGIDLLAEGDRIIASLFQGIRTKSVEVQTWIETTLADAFARLGAINLHDVGVQVVNSLLSGLEEAWGTLIAWLQDKVNALGAVLPTSLATQLGFSAGASAAAVAQPATPDMMAAENAAFLADISARAGVATPDQMAAQTVQAGTVEAGQFVAPEPLLVHQPQQVNAPFNVGGVTVNVQGMTKEEGQAMVQGALNAQAAEHSAAMQSALSD